METSSFLAGGRHGGPARYVSPHAEEQPGADPGGSVIAAWAVFLALYLVLLGAAVVDRAVCVGGSGDPSAWLGDGAATRGPEAGRGDAGWGDAGRAPLPVTPTR